MYGVCFATDFGAIFCSNNTNLTVIPVSKYLPPQYIQRLLNLEGEFDGTVETLKAVPSSCTCDVPEEVPVSLNTRRKEKMSRLERGDGRYSRRKRDPPRDDDSSRGGRRRAEDGRRGGGGGGGGGASSGGSSRSNKSSEKSTQDQNRETTPTENSDKLQKAALDAVKEVALTEETALEVAKCDRKWSEFSIIDNSFPCAPDGFIPNSVARIMFTHLLEFQLLFNKHSILRPQPPVTEATDSFAILSIPSKFSIHPIVEEEKESIMDIIVTQDSKTGLVTPSPRMGDGFSALFMSTTGSTPSETTMASTSPIPSSHLIDVINNSKQSVKEKRSTFAGIALSEAPSYSYSERVPRSIAAPSSKSISFEQKSALTVTSSLTELSDATEGAVESISEVKIPVPAKKRKMSIANRKMSKARKSTISKPKKRKESRFEGDGLKKKGMIAERKSRTDAMKTISSVENCKSGVMSSESGDVILKPTVTITSLPETESEEQVALPFRERLKEIKTKSDPKERLVSLSRWVDRIKTESEHFLFIKNLDEFLNVENKPQLSIEEVKTTEEVALKLYESGKIDATHYTELLKSLMECKISDFQKFKILSSIIKVHRKNKKSHVKNSPETKEVLMDILPFLVHEDDEIKDKAFKELSEYADINTKEELRELLIGLEIMDSSSGPDDIEIVSGGKILNIQYWRNKVENPEPSLSSKVSEEIQIVSEFEIQVNPSNVSKQHPTKTSKHNLQNQRKSSKSNSSQKKTSRDLLRQNTPKTTQTPPGSLADIAEDYKSKSGSLSTFGQDSTFDLDMTMSGGYPESEEDALVSIPSIDIKRRIMNCTGKEVKERGQMIGELRDRGKLYNSTNDLMLWFQKDDDQFYDPNRRVVGSLLPNGDVSIPDNMNLVIDRYVVKQGMDLVRNVANCDNQGRIKNQKGENLGSLTKEGEFISKDGILFTCEGLYAGKMCPDGNRMYVNGEIFNKQNVYWGHVGPDNTMIHLSGRIFDSSGSNKI